MDQNINTEWLSAIVHHFSEGAIIIDRERIIRFANDAAAALADRSSGAALIGVSYSNILEEFTILDLNGNPPDPTTFPSYQAFTEGVITRDFVVEFIHHTRHRWIRITGIPLRDSTGTVTHVILFFRDISERKLREDKLHFMVQSAKILSITTDFHTRLVEKAKLTVPSLADWCTVNVVNYEGDMTRIAAVHRDPEKTPILRELVELSAQLPGSKIVEEVIRTRTPMFFPDITPEDWSKMARSEHHLKLLQALQVSSTMVIPIHSGTQILGVLSIAYGQSGRKYTEQDFEFMQEFCHHLNVVVDNARLYEELKARDKAKDSFLATLSHELRNPLAPIKSALEVLKLKKPNPELQEELHIIERQFDHLSSLLNDLLDVARFTEGKIYLDKQHIDLKESIAYTVRATEAEFRQKNIRLEVSLPDEPMYVWGDETRLIQAIMNLLHNAGKFTPEGGTVWVTGRNDEDAVICSIGDTGRGIPEEDLQNIFNIHAPRRKGPDPSYGGLGIGLPLVKQIIDLHGGTVVARSPGMGQGSEFEIQLPVENSSSIIFV